MPVGGNTSAGGSNSARARLYPDRAHRRDHSARHPQCGRIPKFIDLGREARIAKLEAARGSVGSAAVLANSLSLTQGLASMTSVNMGGSIVTMALSYPTPDIAGIVVAAGLNSRDYTFEPNNIGDPPGSVRIKVAGGSNINTCFFVYTSPFVQGNFPIISNITTASTAGC
jgi:MSHA pilin protein MshA